MKKHELIANPQMLMSIATFLPSTLASCLYGAVKQNAAKDVSKLKLIDINQSLTRQKGQKHVDAIYARNICLDIW